MAGETVLVIEDEKNIVELVKYNLEQHGYRVFASLRGDGGLEAAQVKKPDIIILDLMLPGMDGVEVLKTLRRNEKTAGIPVILLTAKSAETDKVLGLEIGADDYMTKPFSPRELVARVKAVLRRFHASGEARILKAGHLEMDVERHIVTVKGRKVELTSKEYELLRCLMEAHGRVLSRDQLLNKVWGYDESLDIETRTVDMHIGQLRKKIKPEGERIVTVKNAGYRFENED